MHPAFALVRVRLAETHSELDNFLKADRERLSPSEDDQAESAVWVRTVARASGVEGVYTGMENVLKAVLSVVDDGVFANSDSYHAQLLAQAAAETDIRKPVIDRAMYEALDELRRFRHRERVNYRHVLKEALVNENVEFLKRAFPSFEQQIEMFIASWERKPTETEEPSSHGPK